MARSPLDDDHAPLYTVGQVAEMLAVKQAFLRRIDALQVVSPQRSPGNQRRYTRYQIRVIEQVASMADEGITLQAIRRIIELERQLAEVTRQRDELARRLAEKDLFLSERTVVTPRGPRSGTPRGRAPRAAPGPAGRRPAPSAARA
jgi:DNA-binding transcriptional MerR regulator